MRIINLGAWDWVVIVIYFLFIIGMGIYLRRFTRSGKDFFLAGRRNTAWVAGLAFLSANLGALEILAWTGSTLKYGMVVAHFYWIGAIPAMLFLGLYMMPFYYSSRIHSVPGYLRLRFDEKTRLLNAFSFAVMTILMSGINLYLMALVFRTILGWNWDACMWASALTVACYVTLGGLISAIFTEIVQFFLIWFGLFLVSVLGIIEMGGVQAVLANVDEGMRHLWSTSLSPTQNAMGVTWIGIAMGLGFVLSFGYWTTDFLVVQRAFSARDLRTARMTPIIASFFKMCLPFIVVMAGLVAWKLAASHAITFELNAKGEPNYDAALPMLIARYYPEGLMGLGVTALLAGFMAGQAGNISAFNTVWTYDIYHVIYRAVVRKDASDAHLVWMGRAMTIAGILLSVGTAYWARQFPTIMDYIQAIFSWVNAPLFATMLLGMFWKRTTSNGAFVGLIAGMVTSFALFLAFRFQWLPCGWTYALTLAPGAAAKACMAKGGPVFPGQMSMNMWQAAWAWIVCFGVTILVSLSGRPKKDEELVGLVKGLTKETAGERPPLLRSPAFWAVVALAALIGLNIYFW
jgi:SSS family solute:Na+ symporter